MSTRFLRSSYQNLEEAVKDITVVANSHLRDDAQPERWNIISAIDCRVPSANPATLATFTGGIQTYSFISNATNELHMVFELPATWKQGTPLVPILSWANASGGAGSVLWGL